MSGCWMCCGRGRELIQESLRESLRENVKLEVGRAMFKSKCPNVDWDLGLGTWHSGLSSFLVKILSLKKFVGKVLFGGA